MAEFDGRPDEDAAGGFSRYPAPGRPEQPMPGPQSVVPWLVVGGVLALLAIVGPIILYIVMSPGP